VSLPQTCLASVSQDVFVGVGVHRSKATNFVLTTCLISFRSEKRRRDFFVLKQHNENEME
jgi:hypothetical protein